MRMTRLLLATVLLLAPALVLAQPGPGPGPLPEPLTLPTDPVGNPSSSEKVRLGMTLFWDEQLSSTDTVACGTCHGFDSGGTDGRSRTDNPEALHPGADAAFGTADDVIGSPGVVSTCANGSYRMDDDWGYGSQVTGRKANTVVNTGHAPSLFWDGRAEEALVDPLSGETTLAAGAAVESQALGPPVSSVEMAHEGRTWEQILAKLERSAPLALAPSVPAELATWIGDRDYGELFEEVFGSSELTASRVAMAIAAYERTLVANETPFDRLLAGTGTLTAAQQRGLNIFRQRATACSACHEGALTTDNDFHMIGVSRPEDDEGRGAVTGLPQDQGRFKTPPLRNLALRAPFMHDGSLATLEDVIDFYDVGGTFDAPNKDQRIRPLNLTPNQRADLLAFLRDALADPRVPAREGPFAHPTLSAGSARSPELGGTGIAGAGGFTPRMIAREPPLAGHRNFTVAVLDTISAAAATFVLARTDPIITGDPGAVTARATATVTTGGNGPGDGYASVSVALPQEPGLTLVGRWFIEDPAAPGGFAISDAVTVTLFAPTVGRPAVLLDGNFESAAAGCE